MILCRDAILIWRLCCFFVVISHHSLIATFLRKLKIKELTTNDSVDFVIDKNPVNLVNPV